MKLSKSKLALAKIINENGGWQERALWGNAQTLATSGSDATATAGTPNTDTHGGVSGNAYIIPISGLYSITASNSFTASATGKREVRLQVSTNGGGSWSDFAIQDQPGSSAAQTSLALTRIRQFNAADQVRVVLNQTSGASLSTVSDGSQNFLSIQRISGPSQIAASESVNARYYSSSTSITGSAGTITYSTKDYDSHNAYSSGTYTIPVSGKYEICASLQIAGTFALNNSAEIRIFKNGTIS